MNNLLEMEHFNKESKHVHGKAMKKDDILSSSSSFHSSGWSSSSSHMVDDHDDDASSTPPYRGPLYDLTDLIAQLPIKRGLSKFYNGKSQTFASLSNLKVDEDIGKKEIMRRRMNLHKLGPKPTITKKKKKRRRNEINT